MMTLFVSAKREFYQRFKLLVPATFTIHYTPSFSLSECDGIKTDFFIVEADALGDPADFARYPHDRMIILGTEEDSIEKLHGLLQAPAKYFPRGYELNEIYRYLIQQRHYKKQKAEPSEPPAGFGGIIGSSRAMGKLRRRMEQYGPVDDTVTILGDSGTGKELVARGLHEISGVKGEFVAKNCCAIPDLLLESELFGTKKGAYTDSIERKGLFERARGGTLFLDEIGDTSPAVQAKILRAVETKTITPLGGSRSLQVNARIVTATSRDLKKMVEEGSFRRDLYYRINTLIIQIPPLRDRKEDIPLLCRHFLKTPKHLSRRALEKMLDYDWPGNIRELRSVVRRAEIHSVHKEEIGERQILFC